MPAVDVNVSTRRAAAHYGGGTGMADQQGQTVQITEADVQSAAAKLKDFVATLPPAEQAVIGMLLDHASGDAADDDVQGYNGFSFFNWTYRPNQPAVSNASFFWRTPPSPSGPSPSNGGRGGG